MSANDRQPFWSQVNRNGPVTPYGRCWLWPRHSKGKAPRRAWQRTNGPIPKGLHVCHKCDNPLCVRPSHLFLGTNNDNRQDSVQKKRHAHGERHGAAKLTDEQVAEIRRRYHRRSYHDSNKNELAKEFKVHPEYIGLLVRNTYRKEKTRVCQ